MLRQFFLELRVSFDNNVEEKEQHLLRAVREAARTLITQAQLISDERPPSISVHSTDMFQGSTEVSILEEEEAGDTPSKELTEAFEKAVAEAKA